MWRVYISRLTLMIPSSFWKTNCIHGFTTKSAHNGTWHFWSIVAAEKHNSMETKVFVFPCHIHQFSRCFDHFVVQYKFYSCVTALKFLTLIITKTSWVDLILHCRYQSGIQQEWLSVIWLLNGKTFNSCEFYPFFCQFHHFCGIIVNGSVIPQHVSPCMGSWKIWLSLVTASFWLQWQLQRLICQNASFPTQPTKRLKTGKFRL